MPHCLVPATTAEGTAEGLDPQANSHWVPTRGPDVLASQVDVSQQTTERHSASTGLENGLQGWGRVTSACSQLGMGVAPLCPLLRPI